MPRPTDDALTAAPDVAAEPEPHPNLAADTTPTVRQAATPDLVVAGVTVGYSGHTVLRDVTAQFPPGQVTALLGANGSGKSTLLRGIAGVHPVQAGTVRVCGRNATELSHRQRARCVAYLPQAPAVPVGVSVAELVSRGRTPHQSMWSMWSGSDTELIADCLAQVHAEEFATTMATDLSGGQLGRVWLAMVLAQQTPVVLLDEPTAALDMNHAVDVLALMRDLAVTRGVTIVVVLHDVTMAARFAHHVVALHDGGVAASGPVRDVVTEAIMNRVYSVDAEVLTDRNGSPVIVPHRAHRPTPQ